MKKITRDQVLDKLVAVQSKIKEIKSKEKYSYKTIHKHIPGAGKVHEIETERDIVIAHSKVNTEILNLNSSAQALGVSLDKSAYEFLGFNLQVWEEEIKARLIEIRDKRALAQLRKAETLLTANLSEDDKFNLDMNNIGVDLSNL
jgi:hypothetical protein